MPCSGRSDVTELRSSSGSEPTRRDRNGVGGRKTGYRIHRPVAAASSVLGMWVVMALVSACGGSSSASGTIIFTGSTGEGTAGLYVVGADGSGLHQLAANAFDAAVSPDGRRIAFVRDGAIWLMGRDGSDQSRLTAPGPWLPDQDFPGGSLIGDLTPAWSSDGRSIYFSRLYRKTASGSLFSVNRDGSGLRRLVAGQSDTGTAGYGSCHDSPSASPHGRFVAFSSTSDCGHGYPASIRFVTPSGQETTPSFLFPADPSGELITRSPAWSPTGDRLAYDVVDTSELAEGRIRGASGIYVSGRSPIKPKRVAGESGSNPAWSPDGSWIAYTKTADNGSGRVWLVRPDGGGAHLVVDTPFDQQDPVWLPPK